MPCRVAFKKRLVFLMDSHRRVLKRIAGDLFIKNSSKQGLEMRVVAVTKFCKLSTPRLRRASQKSCREPEAGSLLLRSLSWVGCRAKLSETPH